MSLEIGWLSLAHNLLKWATVKEKERVLVEIEPPYSLFLS